MHNLFLNYTREPLCYMMLAWTSKSVFSNGHALRSLTRRYSIGDAEIADAIHIDAIVFFIFPGVAEEAAFSG